MTDAPPVVPAAGPGEAGTRDAVFAVAERLFAVQGFQNVSVRDITGEARVNLASVNYHFGSKDALLFDGFDNVLGYYDPMANPFAVKMNVISLPAITKVSSSSIPMSCKK